MRVARCTAVMLVLVALVSSVPCVMAPKVSFWTAESGAGSSGVLPTVAPAAAAIVGTAAAVGAVVYKQSFFTSAGGIAPSAGGNTTAPAGGAAAGTSATWGRGQQTAFRVPPAWTASEEATSNMCEDASSDDSDDSDEPTLRVGMPLAWPSGWNPPAIAEGTRPVYFAYVHLHAGPAVESTVVERLEARLRSEVNAFDVGTVYFHHRMELVASKAGLSDQAQACLRQLLALIDATGTAQLPTPAGRVIPMDVGALAVPGETVRSTEPARLDRLLVKQLLECLPD